MEVQIETTYGATKMFVASGLENFNRSHQTASPPKSFAVTVKEKKVARGGLVAEGLGKWMVLTLLWLRTNTADADLFVVTASGGD